MIVAALVVLAAAALAPLLDRALRRVVADPVLLVAALSAGLVVVAATLAVAVDDDGTEWTRAVAAALGVLVAVTCGSHVVRAVFRLTRREIWPTRADDRDATDDQPLELPAPGSVLRGGAWIGYLERAATSATLLAGFPEGLALVLAVKGVGRYPELREAGRAGPRGADAPEEFIIGTLASLLWAGAAAGTSALLR